MAGVYSTRFLLAIGAGNVSYTVPPGKRAVIKCFTIANGGGSTQFATLVIAGASAWIASVPGNSAQASPGLGVVVNAGEVMTVAHGAAQMYSTVSGYLLDATP